MTHKVRIAKWRHDEGKTIAYAEGEIDDREFTASWASFAALGAILYNTWLDTTRAHNRAVAGALKRIGALPEVRI